MYLKLGLVSCDRFVKACLPNITKNGNSLECWFGNQLYEAVAMGATSFHSLCLEMCLQENFLRTCKILQYTHLIEVCMEVSRFSPQLQALLQP